MIPSEILETITCIYIFKKILLNQVKEIILNVLKFVKICNVSIKLYNPQVSKK